MGKQVLRFGIHDSAGHRAATWKLLTGKGSNKSDVYLVFRELNNTLKVSLHGSGQWHIAHSRRTFEEDVKGTVPKFEDRYIEKWSRPPDIAPGITLALRIGTPWWAVSTPVKEDRVRGVTWLPNAPEPRATEIDILISKPMTPLIEWPGRRSMDTSFIGALLLENGEIIWAVYQIVDMPDYSRLGTGTGWFYKGKNEKDLEGEGLRGFAFGREPDDSRVIHDLAVQSVTRIE